MISEFEEEHPPPLPGDYSFWPPNPIFFHNNTGNSCLAGGSNFQLRTHVSSLFLEICEQEESIRPTHTI